MTWTYTMERSKAHITFVSAGDLTTTSRQMAQQASRLSDPTWSCHQPGKARTFLNEHFHCCVQQANIIDIHLNSVPRYQKRGIREAAHRTRVVCRSLQ